MDKTENYHPNHPAGSGTEKAGMIGGTVGEGLSPEAQQQQDQESVDRPVVKKHHHNRYNGV